MAQRDPNRFADGLEASSIRARLERDEAELSVLRQNLDFAEQSLRDADVRFREAEKIYYEHKALRNDASAYVDLTRRKCDEQQIRVATQRAYFHPIRRAPLEVLGRVFEIGVEDIFHGDLEWASIEFDALTKERRLPFTVSSVCRRWRAACLAAPRAWAHVVFSLSEFTSQRASYWNVYLDLVLSRSSASPLMLTLHRARGRPSHDGDNHLISKLLQHMSRCVQFHLLVHRLYADDAILPLLSACAPHIRRIYIDVDRDCTSRLRATLPFPSSTAVEDIVSKGLFAFSDAVLSNARKITLNNVVCSDLLRIMEKALTLHELRLNFPSVAEVINTPSPYALEPLQILVVEVTDNVPFATALTMFSFPNLVDLTLHGIESNTGNRLEFLRLISAGCHLTHLCLTCLDPLLASNFGAALQELKSLYDLTMNETRFTAHSLRVLCRALLPVNDDSAGGCPDLAFVTFGSDCSFESDCNPNEVLDLVRARQAADTGPDGDNWWFIRFTVGGWEGPGRGGLQAEIDELLKVQDEPHAEE